MAPLEVFTSGGFPYEEDVVPIETLLNSSQSVSASELDPGFCPSGDVNQDLSVQGASVSEPKLDPGSSFV